MNKKIWVSLLLVLSLMFSFTQVYAYGPSLIDGNHHPTKTPGKHTGKPEKTAKPGNGHGSKDKDGNEDDTQETEEAAEATPSPTEIDPTDVPSSKHGQPKNKQHNKNVSGTITQVDGNTVTITSKDGTTTTVTLDSIKNSKAPGHKDGTPLTLQAGEKLVVRTVTNPDGTISVVQAHVIPAKPEHVHHVGVVTAYVPGVSVTILSKDGTSTTFAITADTRLLSQANPGGLAVGTTITVIFPRSFTGTPIVKGIVVHPLTTPTVSATGEPIVEPTLQPTIDSTVMPTEEPTLAPTEAPTAEPTLDPTAPPTVDPAFTPTATPFQPVTGG